ncbi:DNA cytosine methyltransferase [Vibrio parahaemolyticus]|uniref:DNA cytosine methyltransferase n=1 Tax=Vibrio parahaemolyticus TaxID=670 RepID=UPI001A8FBD92|nr:DNA cytosine methyltransferase [Vibrio parahaemolyticus]MBO0180119.1 DNA cytosine methyltransferase [Vibrio parahaemolyticus]MDF5359899.1 DNA cytosine methyltransferase [Vibrio parahaemolyticus]MDG2754416.1 DNA cytosine methyltransferase [Vibrio parahaemolyticus]MDG2764520.1 DNA cytosine methyltransferase [Vibrio parahaemolyticus]
MSALENQVKVNLNIPNIGTKKLKITQYSDGKRKFQLSSNLLPLFNFNKGDKVYEESRGEGLGYVIRKLNSNPLIRRVKHVYSRTYKRRLSNPCEVSYESTAKDILASIPDTCTHVQVIMQPDCIYVLPINNIVADRINKVMTAENPFTVFSCCSSGIDGYAAFKAGFQINSLLDWRPIEARDEKKRQDFSESGVLTALNNLKVKHVFNQDITDISTGMLKRLIGKDHSTVLTISLQCDGFSGACSPADKQRAIDECSSNIDMLIDGLRLVSALQFPIVVLEQVPGFKSSDIGNVWNLRLSKMGYKVHEAILDSRDYGGLTSRKRYFSVASTLPLPFEFPTQEPRRTTPFWDEIESEVGELRNVTKSSSIQKGAESGRLRAFNRESLYANSLLKSQSRMCKDSVVFEDDGEYYFPNEILEKKLMTVPDSFSLNATSKTLASEILGQGVCFKLYNKLMLSVKNHIESFITNNSHTNIDLA